MYKAVFKIQSECIDVAQQQIFAPFVRCYYIHNIVLLVNGIAYEESIDFELDGFLIKWNGDFSLATNESIVCQIDYHYMKPDEENALDFIVDSTYTDPDKTNSIISKHYVRGQFSLDNGLYNNAVSNFGTTLEGILNKKFSSQGLNLLIDKKNTSMVFLKKQRNKVHPNRISEEGEVARKEAIEARIQLEKIILEKFKILNPCSFS